MISKDKLPRRVLREKIAMQTTIAIHQKQKLLVSMRNLRFNKKCSKQLTKHSNTLMRNFNSDKKKPKQELSRSKELSFSTWLRATSRLSKVPLILLKLELKFSKTTSMLNKASNQQIHKLQIHNGLYKKLQQVRLGLTLGAKKLSISDVDWLVHRMNAQLMVDANQSDSAHISMRL